MKISTALISRTPAPLVLEKSDVSSMNLSSSLACGRCPRTNLRNKYKPAGWLTIDSKRFRSGYPSCLSRLSTCRTSASLLTTGSLDSGIGLPQYLSDEH